MKHLQLTSTAILFKQWGGPNKKTTGRKLDGRTWDAMPAINSYENTARQRAITAADQQPEPP
ncbi:MAG: hypothetical protein F4Y47_08930 [Acidobacteriia bacterium]|nr:hypothetical protein [Terriglobia bacterium]